MYKKIVNPETGRKVNIFGPTGKRVLKNYRNVLQHGGRCMKSSRCPNCNQSFVRGVDGTLLCQNCLKRYKYDIKSQKGCTEISDKKQAKLGPKCNWKKAIDENSGEPYYYDDGGSENCKTTWDAPDSFIEN